MKSILLSIAYAPMFIYFFRLFFICVISTLVQNTDTSFLSVKNALLKNIQNFFSLYRTASYLTDHISFIQMEMDL